MPGRKPKPEFHLPRHWSRRVRSAVLHGISLASLLGRRGQRIDLSVTHMDRRSHLPIVELKTAA